MNCTTQCSETNEWGNVCRSVENLGKTKFPWVVTSNQNLYKEDAFVSDFRYATQFPDPEAVREEFADNATFWFLLRSCSLTVACIISQSHKKCVRSLIKELLYLD